MKEVYISNTAAISAIGSTIEEMWPKLCHGESALGEIKRFSTKRLEFHKGAAIPWLDESSANNRIVELTEMITDQLGEISDDTYVIWAGIKGDVEYIENQSREIENTPYYLGRHYMELVRSRLGIKNSGMEVNAACASSTVALALGAEMISTGRQSSVLVICADILSRFSFTGFSALRGLTSKICRPFDSDRDGLCLGDGAAALLLTNEEQAKTNGLNLQARLSGWGISNDANHITGPAKDARGLIIAIRSALTQAGIKENEVEAFCAHGTGTVYNDAMELTAVQSIFGERKFPLFSVKGSIGHTLGAAGAIESVVSIKAISTRTVPATAGFRSHEERTKGRVSASKQAFEGNNILTTNSGFGGCNAALIFERV
ncbi:MAG: beta-ketoacyl synthase N-terminal-like domain-containing protein [bacterium]|nr:beta-ketoacyl synthase N-terminal-like domain-containing protein [bacterium]